MSHIMVTLRRASGADAVYWSHFVGLLVLESIGRFAMMCCDHDIIARTTRANNNASQVIQMHDTVQGHDRDAFIARDGHAVCQYLQ